MMDLQRKTCDLASFKFDDTECGGFLGWASVFGVLDRQGDIVAKGAFADTIEQFKQTGFIAIAHDWDALPVATIRDAYEDDKGLFIDCEFHSSDEAQAARTYVRERINRKKSVGLSIGYFVKDSLNTPEGHVLKAIDLAECSIVTLPACPPAGVSRVKGAYIPLRTDSTGSLIVPDTGRATTAAEKALYLNPYTEMEATWSAISSLSYALQEALYQCLFSDEATRAERLAKADACLAEYHALVLKGITALYPEDADMEALAATVKAAWNLSDQKASDPPAGKEFDRQIETALADVADLIRRSREIAALRAKAGRTLSAARREDLTALHTDLGRLIVEVAPRASEAELRAAELSLYAKKAHMRAYG